MECDVWCGVGLRILCQHNLPKSVAFKSLHNASIILKKGCGQVAYHTSTAASSSSTCITMYIV